GRVLGIAVNVPGHPVALAEAARPAFLTSNADALLGFGPRGTEPEVDDERDLQGAHGLHDLAHERVDALTFVERHLEHEFVVDGEDHAGPEAAVVERLIELDHGQLENVGGGALYRRVLRHALAHLPDA